MSAAFDTVDHVIMCQRLEVLLGLRGTALEWFRSYLSSRSQCVSVGDALSEMLCLLFGVPQGSVLGPILFTIYILPLAKIAERHDIDMHMYADDSQVYVTFDICDAVKRGHTIQQAEACISEIQSWMVQNKLQLNGSKTEIVVFISPYTKRHHGEIQLQICEDLITSSVSARNLGTTLDRHLSMEDHIAHVCRSCYFHIRNVKSLKPILNQDALISVVHAFISSRLDYCNSLLYGLPDKQIQKLQRIQNIAARLVSGSRKFDHVTPVLRDLHWLPVRQRIQFKILTLTFKALNGLGPEYLMDLLKVKENARTLRSSSELCLCVPSSHYKFYGDRAFCVAAPTLWNKLPGDIRKSKSLASFKKSLKTHLFRVAFC